MFTVYWKVTSKPVKVYDIRNDKSGYPQFLIKIDRQWKYLSAKNFLTEEEVCVKIEKWNIENGVDLVFVIKKDGTFEEYDEQKIINAVD